MSFHTSPILPSIIAKDQDEFAKRLMTISFSHSVHVDVMDGVFVPSISFAKEEHFIFTHLKHFQKVEVHLMVAKPRHWIEYLHDVTDVFIVHAEIPTVREDIAYIKSFGKKVGVAFNPKTGVREYDDLLQLVDQVTIMTVEPGFYGAKFKPDMLAKVSEIKSAHPHLLVECDGGMNEHTIIRAQSAGANLFVAGSTLQNADVPQNKFQLLNELIEKK